MRKIVSVAALAGGLLHATAIYAATPNMQPGLWEISSSMEMPGMPMQMPATTVKHCYTKNDLADAAQVVPKDDKCELSNFKVDGNKASWNMQCKGEPAMSGSGTVAFNPDSYAGNINMSIQSGAKTMQMAQKFSARRVGDCGK